LRLKTVVALVEANKEFIKKDIELRFSIVIALDIQKRMENRFNPQYVADQLKVPYIEEEQ
jgi:D-alanyl-D-alanine dipeptidase